MSGDDFKSIPLDLPPRFELRRLEEKHVSWACAIVTHSNMFHNPVWPVLHSKDKIARTYEGLETMDYLIRHQITSGLSFGIFDMKYQLKRPESEPTEGKLYWDSSNPSKDESGAELLEQMDFPLCSVALSYDGNNPLDPVALSPLIHTLPAFPHIYTELHARDKRDPKSWGPTGPRQVLMRNATSTRREVEGHGVMKRLAQFVMRYADHLGYRGIQIECVNDKVTSVWSNPPSPFKGDIVSEFNTGEFSTEIDGKVINPFEGTHQRITKVYVTLKEHTTVNQDQVPEELQVGGLG